MVAEIYKVTWHQSGQSSDIHQVAVMSTQTVNTKSSVESSHVMEVEGIREDFSDFLSDRNESIDPSTIAPSYSGASSSYEMSPMWSDFSEGNKENYSPESSEVVSTELNTPKVDKKNMKFSKNRLFMKTKKWYRKPLLQTLLP